MIDCIILSFMLQFADVNYPVMVLISDWVSAQFLRHKNSLNFSTQTDDEFLSFLLSTVSNIVQSVKPVFQDNRSQNDSSLRPGSPKRRLNAERFPTEQVNKLTDTLTLTLSEDSDKTASPQPQTKSTSTNSTYILPQIPPANNVTNPGPASLLRTPIKIPDKNLVLTPKGKFFSDICYENDSNLNFAKGETRTFDKSADLKSFHDKDAPVTAVQKVNVYTLNEGECNVNEEKENVNTMNEGEYCVNEKKENVNTVKEGEICVHEEEGGEMLQVAGEVHDIRRVTDCRDKRCMFCPSYDPAYASAIHELLDETLDDGDDLELYKSATDSTENDEIDTITNLVIQECTANKMAFPSDLRADKLVHNEYKGSTYMTEDEENQTVCSWHDWSMITAANETQPPNSPTIIVPNWIRDLSDKELRTLLISKGALVGAISETTRVVYEQYLVKLDTKPLPELDNSLDGYPRELISCLQGQPQVDWSEAEREMVEEFQTPVVGRRYRQGTMKCFFNYLLIDPRIADDLPKKAETLNPREVFKLFIKSVFYVGKGKQSRPYAHLFEASLQNKDSEKLRKIRSIWTSGRGVVSLHVYNNTIAEEAFTREGVMIGCIGLKKLANEKRGEFYGVSKSWSAAKRRGVGLSLLYKAHLTLINEGHREIKQCDVAKGKS
ncbi:uncharacterized protein LOC134819465 isoform X2 [Bolinopsis microptera]|uniref:uncharacterized protein LOC134819465 isoform X2 n=1 Tax=Bolinopsis microptera TaxID=2820187 RepID=UPI003079254E